MSTLQEDLLRGLRLRGQLPSKHAALVEAAEDQSFGWGEHSSNWSRAKSGERAMPVDALRTLAFARDGAGETIVRVIAEDMGVTVAFDRDDDVRPVQDLREASCCGTEQAALFQQAQRRAQLGGMTDANRRELLDQARALRDLYAGAVERLERDLSSDPCVPVC